MKLQVICLAVLILSVVVLLGLCVNCFGQPLPAGVPAAMMVPSPQTQAASSPVPLEGSIASHSGWPEPGPADVSSPLAIVNAVYDVISGPKGQDRDWQRMRSLFLPDARLIPSRVLPGSPNADKPNTDAVMMPLETYISRSGNRMKEIGFFEHAIHNEIEQYGNIVQVWSTYESRHAADDPKPFARGINSFQILKDGDRYWIVNIFWDAETPRTPIPSKYLGK